MSCSRTTGQRFSKLAAAPAETLSMRRDAVRTPVAAVDAVYGEKHRGIALFSVCDGKARIGAGDNNIAVANYLNAKPFTTK